MMLGFFGMTWLLVTLAVVGANGPQQDMQLGGDRNPRSLCNVKMHHWDVHPWRVPSIAGLATYNSGMALYNSNRIPSNFDEPNATVVQQLMLRTMSVGGDCSGDSRCKMQQQCCSPEAGDNLKGFPRCFSSGWPLF